MSENGFPCSLHKVLPFFPLGVKLWVPKDKVCGHRKRKIRELSQGRCCGTCGFLPSRMLRAMPEVAEELSWLLRVACPLLSDRETFIWDLGSFCDLTGLAFSFVSLIFPRSALLPISFSALSSRNAVGRQSMLRADPSRVYPPVDESRQGQGCISLV